jgi:hypothetical protein
MIEIATLIVFVLAFWFTLYFFSGRKKKQKLYKKYPLAKLSEINKK